MAENKECLICRKMTKQKHKFDLFYRIGFWVMFTICLILLALYIGSGDVFRVTENVTEINNNSNIDINKGNNNSINIDNGHYNIS